MTNSDAQLGRHSRSLSDLDRLRYSDRSDHDVCCLKLPARLVFVARRSYAWREKLRADDGCAATVVAAHLPTAIAGVVRKAN